MHAQNPNLSEMQKKVLFEKNTEPPFSGEFVGHKEDGSYHCVNCGVKLFDSETKFDSGTGWPSFTQPVVAEAVETRLDDSGGLERTEVLCRNCGGHLGHVFPDGPEEKGGKRYCINSCALDFGLKDGGK